MRSKNKTGIVFVLSLFAYCALSINLSPVSEASGLKSLLHYISQFNGFSVQGTFLFLGLFLYFQKTAPAVHCKKIFSLKPELILSALFSFFIVIGASFENTGSAKLMYGFHNGQTLIAATVFIGYFIVFFYGITYLFGYWDQYSNEEGLPCNNTNRKRSIYNRPFLFVFLLLSFAYLPRAIISFPGICMGDTPWQIAQAFPELTYPHIVQTFREIDLGQYIPPKSELLSESVFINMHHPVLHTLLLHACICLGHLILRSWNAGLYIYTLLQGMVFLAAVSYSIATIARKRIINSKYVWFLIAYFFIHPHIHSYLFLATKDVIYSAFFVLFMTHWFLLLNGDHSKKGVCILAVSSIGMILFRNEAKFILPAFLAISFLINKSTRKTAGLLMGTTIAFSLLVFHGLYPALHYTPGSIREMLSIPFQQTARYVHFYQDEVTEQEREAIDRILDFNTLSENYDPHKSDPVKNTYRVTADSKDLIQYFKCWVRMFFKHPKTYIAATVDNYYEYFYPSKAKAKRYTYQWSDEVLEMINYVLKPIGVEFSHPTQFDRIRNLSDAFNKEINRFPLISLIMTPACYVWGVLVILFYSIKAHNNQLGSFIVLPFLAVLVCFLGPTNGSYGCRYLYSIMVFMPLLVPMAVALTKTYKKTQ